jgi:hypothetical protein
VQRTAQRDLAESTEQKRRGGISIRGWTNASSTNPLPIALVGGIY